jgi:hypothetical protein
MPEDSERIEDAVLQNEDPADAGDGHRECASVRLHGFALADGKTPIVFTVARHR